MFDVEYHHLESSDPRILDSLDPLIIFVRNELIVEIVG